MPTANYSHMVMVMELMVDGDDGGGDGGEDGLRIPPPEEKSWIDLSPETKIVMMAAVCFAKAPPFLGQVIFLLYEGVHRRPEAIRCPRPIWGADAATVPGRVGPPHLALRHPLVSIFCAMIFFSINIDVVFFPDFISCKNSQGRDFAKNSIRNSSFIRIWKDLGANCEAKCLEK